MKKIGIFGVTGNPPHIGHLEVVKESLQYCDEVWVTPVYIHPFNKKMESYDHRLNMLNLVFGNIDKVKLMELDKIFYEKENKVPYSYDLLNFISIQNKTLLPLLIIGEDNAKEDVWVKFYKYKEIEEKFGRIIIQDSGTHSTDIRNWILNKDYESVEKYTGTSVLNYILQNKLYGEKNEK